MRKKFWAAMLALTVLLGLTAASALADVMENIQVRDITYYPSGCLEGFTMTYTVGPGLAAADVRVSVQTVQFAEHVSGYAYGDFRDNGRYAQTHSYPTWPETPAHCGFVAWNGATFHRPASDERTSPLEIRFADGQIVWARKAAQAENGEIVLCVLNGLGYCKKLKYDADGVYLVSLNPAYEPIPVQENDEFRIAGVVVG